MAMSINRIIRLGLTIIFGLIGFSLLFACAFQVIVPFHFQGEIIYGLFPTLHSCIRKNTPDNTQISAGWDAPSDATAYINQNDNAWVLKKTLTIDGVSSFNNPVLSADGNYLLVRSTFSPPDECTVLYRLSIDEEAMGSRVYLPDFTLTIYRFGATADDVYLGTRDSQMMQWAIEEGRLTTRLRVPEAGLWISAISSNGLFAAFQNDEGIQVWGVDSGRLLSHFSQSFALTVLNPDGSRLLIYDLDDDLVSVNNPQTVEVLTQFTTSDGAEDFQFTQQGDYIVFNNRSDVVVMDSDSGEQIASSKIGSRGLWVQDTALQPDNNRLAVLACSSAGAYPCAISILSIPFLQAEEQISGLADTYDVRFVDADTLLTIHPEGKLALWRTNSGTE